MNTFTSLVVPLLFLFIGGFAFYKKCDIYGSLTRGARGGVNTLLGILTSVTALFVAIYMMRASGALDILCSLLSPITNLIGIPKECAPLMVIRPLSGSAALAYGTEIMKTYGANSHIGRCAAVMLGASETTFYTIAVYFGAAGIKRTRYAIPAALLADFAGVTFSALAVRFFF